MFDKKCEKKEGTNSKVARLYNKNLKILKKALLKNEFLYILKPSFMSFPHNADQEFWVQYPEVRSEIWTSYVSQT